jgi:hypothetical protein
MTLMRLLYDRWDDERENDDYHDADGGQRDQLAYVRAYVMHLLLD